MLRDHLLELLSPYVKERKLGKIICEQDYDFDGNAHGPDVSFIIAAKVQLVRRERRVHLFVPDLVLSEDRELILSDDKMFESKSIPGFAILLADLFDGA